MGYLPPPTGSRFGMVCPLSIVGTPFQSKRGAVSIRRRRRGEKGCHLDKTAYGSCLSECCFLVLFFCVTFCSSIPTLFAKYLKMFLRGSELLRNLGKMLWEKLSAKTDSPVQLVQILGHWQFLSKAEREWGKGGSQPLLNNNEIHRTDTAAPKFTSLWLYSPRAILLLYWQPVESGLASG